MAEVEPPRDYEEFIRLIHDRYDRMSKAYQKISVYIIQSPNDVAVLSANTIAERCTIHASSLVHFAQALGYEGFKDLQDLFLRRLSMAAPGFEARKKALDLELGARKDRSEAGFFRDLVVRDITSLQEIHAQVSGEDLANAVDLLEKSETIYLIGQLRSAPVVELLWYVLTMLGKRCVVLDPSGGLATYVVGTMKDTDLLFAVSFRFCATEVVNVVEVAAARGIPIVAISDSTLSPLAKSAKVRFSVPEHEYAFSRSLAAPMCLAQALTVALASRRQGSKDEPHIPIVTGQ